MEKIFVLATCQGLAIANLLSFSSNFTKKYIVHSVLNFSAFGIAVNPKIHFDYIRDGKYFFISKQFIGKQGVSIRHCQLHNGYKDSIPHFQYLLAIDG